MSLVGNGNINSHWNTEKATRALMEEGYTKEQIEKLTPRERITLCSGFDYPWNKELKDKLN